MLRHMRDLEPMTEEEFARLAPSFSPSVLRKGEYFTRQNEECDSFAFVVSGCLRAYSIDAGGDEYTMYFAFTEWWIGDKTSFYNQTPARFSIQALEDAELMVCRQAAWERALLERPAEGGGDFCGVWHADRTATAGLRCSGQHQPRDHEIEHEAHGTHHKAEGHAHPEVARLRIASERSSAFQRHDPGCEAVESKQPGNQDEELKRTDEELPQEARSEAQGSHRHRNECRNDEPDDV
jgi:cyclic nucleotide-binding protein